MPSIPALSLNLKDLDIRPGSDLFDKKFEEGVLFIEGKYQCTVFANILFCARETMIRTSRLKLRHFLLSQMTIRNFIIILTGFSFMKQH